jgi:hypothetical protein
MGTENTEAISEQEQRAGSSDRHSRHSRSSEEPTRGKRQDPNLQGEGQAGQQAGEQQQQQQQQTIQFPAVEMSQQQGAIEHDVNDQVSMLTRQLNNQLQIINRQVVNQLEIITSISNQIGAINDQLMN